MKRVCLFGFKYVEVHADGNICPCCPSYTKNICFGNIYKNNFLDIWNSDVAKNFRKKILNDNYSLCNEDICCRSYILIPDNYCKDDGSINSGPEVVKFCHDYECNFSCITCRDQVYRNSHDENKRLLDFANNNLIDLLKDTKNAVFYGSGDPLASRHGRYLIRKTSAIYPNIKIGLHTNGSLCNLSLLKNLNIHDKLSGITISLHAASSSVHEYITNTKTFNKIINNIRALKKFFTENNINTQIILVFVVTNINVHEMSAFASLANKLNCICNFVPFTHWRTKFGSNFDEVNVLNNLHPLHDTLLKELKELEQFDNVRLRKVFKDLIN